LIFGYISGYFPVIPTSTLTLTLTPQPHRHPGEILIKIILKKIKNSLIDLKENTSQSNKIEYCGK
jgi:hypothetical protein